MNRSVLGIVIVLVAAFAPAQDGMLFLPNTSSYVNVNSAPDLMPQGGLTVESWFYFDPMAPGGGNNPTILRKDPGQHPYILRTNSGGGGLMQWIVWTQGGSYTTLESPTTTPLNSWHHLAGTYDGALLRMYLDGVLIASTPKTGALLITSGPLRLGEGGSSSETWKGSIDEVRIWSTVRSAAQIQSTMFKRVNVQTGLVAAWHFDGNFLDSAGAHHGIAVGTPQILPSTSPVQSVYLEAPPIAPIGGPLDFHLFASPSTPYILEISATGTTPGTPIPAPGSGVFPLNEPFLFTLYGGLFPNTFENFVGLTNAAGDAQASLNIHPLASLIGLTVSAAFVTIDGSAPLGIGRISNPTQSTITDYAPTVTTIAPATGPAAGGWPVTITGAHFQPGATVRFGLTPATNVVVSPTTITCQTPPGPLGPSVVVVQNPDGNQVAVTNAFTYVPTLVLSATNPIVAAPGANVTATGGGFTPGLTATLAGSSVTPSAITTSTFSFVMPAGALCSAPLVAMLPDGQSATLAMNPAPSISGIVGPAGNPAGGSTFFLFGSDFHAGTTVTIGGAPAAISNMTTTVILATAPPGQSGPAPLVVSSAAGCSDSATYLYQ